MLFRMALATGMRQGELRALTWENVDLIEGAVQVRRFLARLKKGCVPIIQEPKTKTSRRRIPWDPETLAERKTHRKRQLEERLATGSGWQDKDLVFSTSTGGYLIGGNVRDAFRQLAKKAGVPVIRFHGLRHTHATILLAKGVNVKVVAERLEHSNIRITLQVYSHVLP